MDPFIHLNIVLIVFNKKYDANIPEFIYLN